MRQTEFSQGGSRMVEPLEKRVLMSAVAGRFAFYNNSVWDGSNTAANAADDAAIATDKVALRPGHTASFANYTSFSKGLNGIMVDLSGLSAGATPTAGDFAFKVGNTNAPVAWAAGPAPTGVLVRAAAGTGGATRVNLVWADNAIQKQWLEVTVKANANTGLSAPDVFYFGNAVAESGDNPANTFVNATDEIGARNDPHNFINPAPIINVHDYNRDKKVDATDQILARNNGTNFISALKLITVPGNGPPDLQLIVNTHTGDVQLDGTGVNVSGYEIDSLSGALLSQNWKSLKQQGNNDFAELVRNDHIVGEGDLTTTFSANGITDITNGSPLFSTTGAHDLSFIWTDQNGIAHVGQVVYV